MNIVVSDGNLMYRDIDSVGRLLGVSRRTVYTYLKTVQFKIEDKKKVGSKIYLSDELTGRIWARMKWKEKGGSYKGERSEDLCSIKPSESQELREAI